MALPQKRAASPVCDPATYSAFLPLPLGFDSVLGAGVDSVLAAGVSEDFDSVDDALLSDFVSEVVDFDSAAADFLYESLR